MERGGGRSLRLIRPCVIGGVGGFPTREGGGGRNQRERREREGGKEKREREKSGRKRG